MTTRTPSKIAAEIKAWDTENIQELSNLIEELSATTAAISADMISGDCRVDDYVDLTALPTVEIPDDIDTSYPVWSMDKSGNMLVGPEANEIEHIDDVRAA